MSWAWLICACIYTAMQIRVSVCMYGIRQGKVSKGTFLISCTYVQFGTCHNVDINVYILVYTYIYACMYMCISYIDVRIRIRINFFWLFCISARGVETPQSQGVLFCLFPELCGTYLGLQGVSTNLHLVARSLPVCLFLGSRLPYTYSNQPQKGYPDSCMVI